MLCRPAGRLRAFPRYAYTAVRGTIPMSLITYVPVPYLPTYTFQELKSSLLTKAATRVKFGRSAGALVFPSVVTRCRAAGARAVHAKSPHPGATTASTSASSPLPPHHLTIACARAAQRAGKLAVFLVCKPRASGDLLFFGMGDGVCAVAIVPSSTGTVFVWPVSSTSTRLRWTANSPAIILLAMGDLAVGIVMTTSSGDDAVGGARALVNPVACARARSHWACSPHGL